MAISMWHVPDHSTPDRQWGTDFITDTTMNMDRIAVLLRHIKDNINTVNCNADRISGVNSKGIKPHNFSNSQLTQIGKALNKLDENPVDAINSPRKNPFRSELLFYTIHYPPDLHQHSPLISNGCHHHHHVSDHHCHYPQTCRLPSRRF
jgi:hypothetical protein